VCQGGREPNVRRFRWQKDAKQEVEADEEGSTNRGQKQAGPGEGVGRLGRGVALEKNKRATTGQVCAEEIAEGEGDIVSEIGEKTA